MPDSRDRRGSWSMPRREAALPHGTERFPAPPRKEEPAGIRDSRPDSIPIRCRIRDIFDHTGRGVPCGKRQIRVYLMDMLKGKGHHARATVGALAERTGTAVATPSPCAAGLPGRYTRATPCAKRPKNRPVPRATPRNMPGPALRT